MKQLKLFYYILYIVFLKVKLYPESQIIQMKLFQIDFILQPDIDGVNFEKFIC